MKLFIAALATETNTFSPMPTTTKQFRVARDGNHTYQDTPIVIWRKLAEDRGWQVAESLSAGAEPAGITLKATYEMFRDEILRDLQAAMPVDVVLLDLHGAMVADGYDDCEGDLISRARQIAGQNVPIGVELDPHCHISQTMIEQANVIITYKEYPHTDITDRCRELFAIMADAVEGKVRPHIAMFDCKMISAYYTTREPMRSFVEKMKSLEGKDGVLSVSLGHGFPWGDVPDLGTKVLVVTNNNPQKGAQLAADLGREFFNMRDEVVPKYLSIEDGLNRALEISNSPVVLADVSDNSGGGAPGDSTFILQALLERGFKNAAVGCIWDPIAVGVAIDAGEGAKLDLRVGGKMGPASGDPVDLRVTVGKIALNAFQYSGAIPLGDSVAVSANGIDIVLISSRTQTFTPEVFTNVGIDPMERRLLVVKSTQHFYAKFSPIASEVIYVAAPGAIVPDFKNIPYRRAGRLWPKVENPFATEV
jgi:microcystin degradation protein MlrC